MAGHVARTGDRRHAYWVLVGRPEGKSPLGRPRSRWENNIKQYFEGRGEESVNWIDLTQDVQNLQALGKTVTNLWLSQNPGCILNSCGNVSFKGMNLLHCVSDQFSIYLHIYSCNFSVSCSQLIGARLVPKPATSRAA